MSLSFDLKQKEIMSNFRNTTWTKYYDYYVLYFCEKCAEQIVSSLKESVCIKIINDECNSCIAFGHNLKFRDIQVYCVPITAKNNYPFVKNEKAMWKITNSSRKKILNEIELKITKKL